MIKSMKLKFAISNFLFFFPYCLVLLHGIFIHNSNDNTIQKAIFLGMSLYAGLQVGGVWFASFLPEKWISQPIFWFFLRVVGGYLFLIESPALLILGSGMVGISQALFYKYSRMALATEMKASAEELDQAYTWQMFSTNIAFAVLPACGAFLVMKMDPVLLMTASHLAAFLGLLLISKVSLSDPKQVKGSEENQPTVSLLEAVEDIFHLGSFVIPYAAMMALIPLKAKEYEMGAVGNGLLIGLNAVVVTLILLLKMKLRLRVFSSQFLSENLKSISLASWIFLVSAVILPLPYMAVAFSFWSVLEALQLPTLEFQIFSKRNYSGIWINRILIIDSIGSFAGPIMVLALVEILKGLS